ncbi:MAG: ATP-binding protein, partial [Pirellulales bacterium]
LGMYFPKEYRGYDEINATNRLLHKDDKPTLEGYWLSGGVTLSFTDPPREIPEGVLWENPQIDVLIYKSWEKCHSETHTDIRFCSPQSDQKLRTSTEQDVALPRGKGLSAVYSQPLHEIETGAENIPKSRTVGWDRELDQAEDDIGSIFLKTCGLAAHISGRRYGLIESVDLPRKLGANWVVVPAATIDPALFRDYVTKETGIPFEDRALWDYRISLAHGSSSYFILSAIPPAYRNAVNGVFDGNHASNFIAELGSVGLAIAGEAMKSGQHALGTIGQVAAVRFFIGVEDLRGPLAWGQNHIGFLLPVDAFDEFFDEKEDAASESDLTRKRGDFLAVSVTFPTNQNDAIVVQAVGVECKYRSNTYSSNNAKDGLKQAKVVTDWFKKLCKLAQEEDGIAERLGLLHLMWFGARISGQECPERKELEQRLFEAVLRGEFNFKKASKPGVLISTEMGFRGTAVAEERADGLWVRLNKENWPVIHETDSIRLVRTAISKLFDVGEIGGVTQETGNSASINSVESTPDDQGEEALLEGQDVDSGVIEVMGEVTGGSIHQEQVEETTASTTAVSHQAEGVQLEKILVGMDNDRNTVFFDPHSESTPLDNTNLMVTGSSGKGKTQFIKYFVSQLRGQGVNAIVFALQGDLIGDHVWCENARLEPIHVNFDGLPYNPMIPFPVTHPRTGDLLLDTAGHISALADVFERTYGLGVQQQSHVKEAIRQAFQEREISPRGWVPFDENLIFPDFSQIEDFLREEDEQAYNRLDNLFSLRLFRDEYCQTSFASITEGSKLIGLGGIGSQELRNAIAEMIILSAHAFYTSRPPSSGMKQIFVVDEAHRICEADYVIKFLRECRSFGVGFLLASQFIRDFSPSITGCMATKVIHGND